MAAEVVGMEVATSEEVPEGLFGVGGVVAEEAGIGGGLGGWRMVALFLGWGWLGAFGVLVGGLSPSP